MIFVAMLLAALAAVYDLRKREIPDWIALSLVGGAVVSTAAGWSTVSWLALACGLGLGLVLTLPFYALGAFGGGDVKLVVALGAVLGPIPLLGTLFWMALCGGLLAVVALVRGHRDLAYGPAIALGLLLYWVQVSVHLELARHVAA
jgi:prepilin peptidase CpaA